MRGMLLLAGALACMPMAAHAQSGRDWDRRGDWMQSGDRFGSGDRYGSGEGRGYGRQSFDDDEDGDTSRDGRSAWRDEGRQGGKGEEQGSGGMRRGGMERGGPEHRGMDIGGMHREMMRGMGQRGASFMLRSGDVRLGVRCSPSESMKACVDAATSLMDRAKSMAGTGGSTTSGTGGATTSSPAEPDKGATTKP